MKQIVKVSGKAKNVFKYVEVMTKHKGNVSIEKLSGDKKTRIIELA
jgi:hypothetical protein